MTKINLIPKPSVEDTMKRVTIKNVKDNIGHDRAGLSCDFYLDGKKMGSYDDDGWGGEIDINYVSKETEKQMKDFAESIKYNEYLFNHGWEFMESPDKISIKTQIESLVDKAYNQRNLDKQFTKITKLFPVAFVFGVPNADTYEYIKYKTPLAEIVKYPETKVRLQNRLNEIRTKELKKGEVIFNTNLKELGLE